MKPLTLIALQYGALNLNPITIKRNSKLPLRNEWQKHVGRTEGEIVADFEAPDADGCNIGLNTAGLCVIDADMREDAGKDGLADLQKLPPLPPTLHARTQGGGRHFFFSTDGRELRNRAGLGDTKAVDVRADGGQVLVWPSTIDGRAYEWLDDSGRTVPAEDVARLPAPAPLPEAWHALLAPETKTKPKPRPRGERLDGPGDREFAKERARAYLATVEPARSGEGGHSATFRACCRAAELCLDQEDLLEVMREWNQRCEPPWGDRDLQHKVQDAVNEVRLGCRFDAQEAHAHRQQELDVQLQEMNRDWFVLDYYGDIVVGRHVQEEVARGETRERLVLYAFPAFQRKFSTRLVEVPGRRTRQSIAEVWLGWSGRREYDRLTFDPSGRASADPRVLNLWRSWAVEPKPNAKFDHIKEHVEEVICGGNRKHAAKLWGWLASLVQHPDEPGEMAVVLRGPEGVGKSVLGKAIRRLCGQHGMAVTSPSHLVGNFNIHLRDLVFLEASEALFAGDRAANSKLKALITDDTLAIEGKGRDTVQAPNRLHVLMTTNEDWAVPASAESRRYFMLDVSEARRGDGAYFAALWSEVNDLDALGGLLHFLQTFDLASYSKREVVETDALKDQRERTAQGVVAWALDLASRGELETDKGTLAWSSFFPTQLLFQDQRRWAQQPENRYRPAVGVETFSRELRSVLGLKHLRRALSGHRVPPLLQGKQGYEMPETPEALAELARERGGFQRDAEGEQEATPAAVPLTVGELENTSFPFGANETREAP